MLSGRLLGGILAASRQLEAAVSARHFLPALTRLCSTSIAQPEVVQGERCLTQPAQSGSSSPSPCVHHARCASHSSSSSSCRSVSGMRPREMLGGSNRQAFERQDRRQQLAWTMQREHLSTAAAHAHECRPSPVQQPDHGPGCKEESLDHPEVSQAPQASPSSPARGAVPSSEASASPVVGVTILQSGSGFKKTFFKRHLPSPPATAFASPEGTRQRHSFTALYCSMIP